MTELIRELAANLAADVAGYRVPAMLTLGQ